MKASRKATELEIKRALQYRAKLWSWEMICNVLRLTERSIRGAIDPAWLEQAKARQRNRRRAERGRARRATCGHVEDVQMRITVPAHVLAERDAARSHVHDLTAAVFGDPPPCRSALGRRG